MLTVSRRGALTSALSAHVAQRLVLRMPTEEEMLSLGLDLKAVRGTHLPPGRGFTQDSREFHIALPMEGAIAIGTETAVSAVCVTDERRPPAIEVLPASISRDSLPQPASLDAVPLGIADEDMQPAFVDLLVMHFLVAGPYRSGRSTALATLAHGIAAADARASLHLLAPRRSPLLDLDHLWTTVASGLDACAQASASLLAQLEGDELGRAFVFVDDGGELTDPVSTAKLERLVRLGRDSKARVVTSVEMGAARGIGVAWIRELRREGHGLLLSADPIADGDLLGMRLPRSVVAPAPGRGFLVRPGSAQFIQVAY
jgi:S-DNA-T family DNA segregation ATPase FtsK/SpoIIIE